MKVRVLGTAAGGGLPQWNCGCEVCRAARTSGRHRLQDGLAISGDGSAWYLVNASADLRAQLVGWPEFAPRPRSRASPVRGVLLTSAELDHTLGLLTLREADRLTVYATATVWRGLSLRTLLDPYVQLVWERVVPGVSMILGDLVVTAFAPGDKRPRYATLEGPEWTVAYRFVDPRTGGSLVYAPGLAAWSDAFAEAIAGTDIVLLDGTFASAEEFAPRPAGHLSIQDSLPLLPPGPTYVYTHLNNTNPYALAGRPDGARIAEDGELFTL